MFVKKKWRSDANKEIIVYHWVSYTLQWIGLYKVNDLMDWNQTLHFSQLKKHLSILKQLQNSFESSWSDWASTL